MRSWLIAATLVLSANAQHAQAQSKKSKAAQAEAEAIDEAHKGPKPISIALLAGYGIALNAPNRLNPFGVGFGVRGGHDIGSFYLGARFLFFLGDTEETAAGEASAESITLGLEAGYDLVLVEELLSLRPEAGFGLVVQTAESMTSGTAGGVELPMDESSEVLYISPGFALLVKTGRRSFVGIDTHLPILLGSETVIELTLFATGGLRF